MKTQQEETKKKKIYWGHRAAAAQGIRHHDMEQEGKDTKRAKGEKLIYTSEDEKNSKTGRRARIPREERENNCSSNKGLAKLSCREGRRIVRIKTPQKSIHHPKARKGYKKKKNSTSKHRSASKLPGIRIRSFQVRQPPILITPNPYKLMSAQR